MGASGAMASREVVIPFMISGLFHLAALAAMLYTPALTPQRPSAPPAIHVRMVALPETTVKPAPRKRRDPPPR
jgi:hypothetical protein